MVLFIFLDVKTSPSDSDAGAAGNEEVTIPDSPGVKRTITPVLKDTVKPSTMSPVKTEQPNDKTTKMPTVKTSPVAGGAAAEDPKTDPPKVTTLDPLKKLTTLTPNPAGETTLRTTKSPTKTTTPLSSEGK